MVGNRNQLAKPDTDDIIQKLGRIQKIDHWIAFVLLTLIGANMIREALGEDGNEESEEAPCETDSLSFKSMLLLAIATSIDALAVGVTFAFLKVNIVMAASFIGVTTFIISAVGVSEIHFPYFRRTLKYSKFFSFVAICVCAVHIAVIVTLI